MFVNPSIQSTPLAPPHDEKMDVDPALSAWWPVFPTAAWHGKGWGAHVM